MGLSVALAMILSFVESQVPPLVAIPGVKLGLANIAVVFALYKLGWKEAAMISLIRVFLVTLLFGNLGLIWYSAAGAVLSLAGMVLLKKTNRFSELGVSAAGGVLHNVGQILVASVVMETDKLSYYLPILIVVGVATGLGIGLLAGILVRRIPLKGLDVED